MSESQLKTFGRYSVIQQLKVVAGESDLFIVADASGQYVLKLYRYGVVPKADILKKAKRISEEHPESVIRIFEYGHDADLDRHYEIQEFVRFGTLKSLMASFNPQSRPAAARLVVSQVARSLSVLHENGVLHLDLKPSNILIRSKNPPGLILADFGVSSLLESDQSKRMTSVKGTPFYWAPEAFTGFAHKNSDFWSLGMIALEILLGANPFASMDTKAIIYALTTKGVEIPRSVPEDFKALLRGLLTRDPSSRWNGEMVAGWLAGRVVAGSAAMKYEKPYRFHHSEYYSLEDLAAAFAENESCWDDALVHLSRGYIAKWLEGNEDYDASVEVEKLARDARDENAALFNIVNRFNRKVPFKVCGADAALLSLHAPLRRMLAGKHGRSDSFVVNYLLNGALAELYVRYLRERNLPEDSYLMFLKAVPGAASRISGGDDEVISGALAMVSDVLAGGENFGVSGGVGGWEAYLASVPGRRKSRPGQAPATAPERAFAETDAPPEKRRGNGGPPSPPESAPDRAASLSAGEMVENDYESLLPPEEIAFRAAARGDAARLAALIKKGIDPNLRDTAGDGDTLLIKAAASGSLDAVNSLLGSGADASAENGYGWTALMWAEDRGHSDIVKVLKKATVAHMTRDAKSGYEKLVDEAEAGVAGLVGSVPMSCQAPLSNARSFMKRGMIEEAAGELIKITGAVPKCAEVYGAIATIYEKIGLREEAREYYEMLIRVRPNDPAALEYLDRKKSLELRGEVASAAAEAGALEMKGDCEGAAERYRNALEIEPKNDDLHFRLGQVYEKTGSFQRAAFEYERALDINPEKYRDANVKLASLYRELKDRRSVIKYLLKVRELFPNDRKSRRELLNEYLMTFLEAGLLGEADPIAAAFRRTLASAEGDAMTHFELGFIFNRLPSECFKEKNVRALVPDCLEKAYRLNNPADINLRREILREFGYYCFDTGDRTRAAGACEMYRKYVVANPADLFAIYELGHALGNILWPLTNEDQALQKALALLGKAAVALGEDCPEAQTAVPRLLLRSGDASAAVAAYGDLLAAAPSRYEYLMERAKIFEASGDFENALKYYDKAASVSPAAGLPAVKAVECACRVHEKSPRRVQEYFRLLQEYKRASKRDLADARAHLALGCACLRLTEFTPEDVENCDMELKQALSMAKGELENYWALKSFYIRRSMEKKKDFFDDAVEICRSAAAVAPEDPRVYFETGTAFDENFKSNRKNEAIEEYKKAVFLDPCCQEARYRLALIYKGKKMTSDALREFKKTVLVSRSGPMAADSLRSIEALEKMK